MATKWIISFKTLNNKSAVVSIDDATYSGTPIALQPAASPFSISRNQADIMSPVMSETGYLRIIDNGVAAHDIESIFPTGALDRPVTLTINGNVTWRGYISPESYSTDYNAAPCEIDFAVVGLLDVLQSVNLVNTNVGLKSIGGFIAEILAATGQSWSNVIVARQIQRIYKRDDRVIHQWTDIPEFRILLSRFNFLDPNTASMDDPDWTPFIGKSYHDVLADICRYFGWTASMQGNDLVLCSPRNDISTFVQVAVSALSNFDSSSSVTVTTSSRNTCFVEWDGTSHRKSISNGRKRITITTELNNGDDIMPQLDFNGNEVGTYQERFHWNSLGVGPATGRMKLLDITNENVQFHAYRMNDDQTTYHEIDWANPTVADDLALPGATLVRGCTWEDDESMINYSWRNMLRISANKTFAWDAKHFDYDAPMATITSRGIGAFHDGNAISINATVFGSLYVRLGQSGNAVDNYGITQWNPFNHDLRVSLRIGSRWYTGSGWSDTETIFNIPAGIKNDSGRYIDTNDRGTGQIINTKTLDMPWDGASGYIVPITETIVGTVAITFYPWIYPGGSISEDYNKDYTALFISDLNLNYYSTSGKMDREGLRLTTSTGKNFQNELNVNLRLTSAKDDRIGHALLWFAGSPIGTDTTLTYPDSVTLYKPENWLMQTLLKIYSAPSTQLELEVEYDSNMRMWDMVSVGSKNYIITGMNIDYADEHMTLTLLNYE